MNKEIYKPLVGEKSIVVNSNGEFFINAPVDIGIHTKKRIELTLYGKRKVWDKQKLFLLSWFEIETLPDIENRFVEYYNNIGFIKLNKKSTYGDIVDYYMVFKRPIHFTRNGTTYRVIPNYVGYGVSKDYKFYSLKKEKDVNIIFREDSYPIVIIFSTNRNRLSWLVVHRLIAMAWIDNEDILLKPYVNHIDGNKTNFDINNLEWVSQSENAEHSFKYELNKTQKGIKVRNKETGEVIEFVSVSKFCEYFHLSHVISKRYLVPGYLLKNKYEVKLKDDETEWFYSKPENRYMEPGKSLLIFRVKNLETGEVLNFNRKGKMYKVLNIPNMQNSQHAYMDIPEAIKRLNAKYKHLDFSFERSKLWGPYKCIDIIFNKTYVVNNIDEASGITGLNRNMLRNHLLHDLETLYNTQWIVQPCTKTIDYKRYINYYTFSKFKIENLETKEIKYYDSLRSVIAELGLCYASLKFALDNDGIVGKTCYKIQDVTAQECAERIALNCGKALKPLDTTYR